MFPLCEIALYRMPRLSEAVHQNARALDVSRATINTGEAREDNSSTRL